MAREIPAAPRVYTTKYTNFKGVDFTNDATNVWYRRSPTGVNMLPDDAGQPMKRHGWLEAVSEEDFVACYDEATGETYTDVFVINRCYYFELHGLDHIIVFSNIGVFCYRQIDDDNNVLLLWSADDDCIASYDRTFFFEGNGKSAFYIYGEYRVWRYEWDNDFSFKELTQRELYIPLIRFAVSADGNTGELLEAVNLLGSLVKERFQNNIILSSEKVGDFTYTIDNDKYASATSSGKTFTYTTEWTENGNAVDLADYGITVIGTPVTDDSITVTLALEVTLIREIDPDKYEEMSVCTRDSNGDYTNALEVVDPDEETLSAGQCKPFTSGGVSKIIFADAFPQLVTGEDEIEVIYPRDKVERSAQRTFTATQQMTVGG